MSNHNAVPASRLAQVSARLASLSGISESDSPRTATALKLLDEESVTSIPWLTRSFERKCEAIKADRNLSDIGKAEQARASANAILGNLATIAKRLTDLEAEYEADKASAVPLPKADVSDMLLDLALAQHIRATEPTPSALVQMSERVRLAAARIPPELSGLTPATQAKAHGSLMSPAKAAQLGSEAAALDSARKVAQRAIDEIATKADWPPQEMVRHFGTKWRLPGLLDSTVQRLADEMAGDGNDE